MNYTKSIVVLSALLTIGGIGIMSSMTDEAFAAHSYATTQMTYCTTTDNYITSITQSSKGGSATAEILVPTSVCSNSFVSASITATDASANQCTFTVTSASGTHTRTDCGSSFDVSNDTVYMSISLDYANDYTVNYTQSDNDT